MPRFLVERTFPEGLDIALDDGGGRASLEIVERSADLGVTWIHSYVSQNKRKTFCIYDAPTPEAIRKSAALNELPLDLITEVTVLEGDGRCRRAC